MNKKKILFFLLLFTNFLFSQNIDFKKLEDQIYQNNRAGNHQKSQERLLTLLERDDLSDNDQIKLNLLVANTFRSIGDYGAAIKQLQKTKDLSKNLDGIDSLKMNIDAEMAFVYFDDNKYKESERVTKEIYQDDFKFLKENDKAYVVMQQGYMYYLEKKFDSAAIEYAKSLNILKKASPCNQPVVLVKQMQLYSKINNLKEVDRIYKKAMAIADSCKILKYKVYATEEIKSIYQQRNDKELAFFYTNQLEKLKLLYNKDVNLSNMHLENEEFLEKQNAAHQNNFNKTLFISILGLLLLSGMGIYFYRKSFKYKMQNKTFEAENNAMKEELLKFSKTQFSAAVPKNTILNSKLLNERQSNLLKLMSEGFSNKEIAEKLFISENTVKYHIKNIYEILDLKNRNDLFRKLNT